MKRTFNQIVALRNGREKLMEIRVPPAARNSETRHRDIILSQIQIHQIILILTIVLVLLAAPVLQSRVILNALMQIVSQQ